MLRFLLKLILLPFRIIAWCWRKYIGCYRGKSWLSKVIIAIFSFIIFCIMYAAAVQFNFLWLFGDSPSVQEIISPKTRAASEVYSADGKLIHKFFNENRTPVAYNEISQNFIDALIATEDERFYKHRGIDFIGLFAAAKDAIQGHPRGASTITQQLVKNMHKMRSKDQGLLGRIPGVRMFIMKSKEMIIATEIEFLSTKEDILTMYANTVDFGSNAYGIKTASKVYFNTTPAELKVEEAAVLVGVLKATNAYNPKINPANAKRRRNTVIDNMVNQHFISEAKADSLKQLEIDLSEYKAQSTLDGQALYFRQAVLNEIDEVLDGVDPYTDGLKIYTTLDTRMQKHAEEAVCSHMKQLQADFNSSWGDQDPWIDDNNKSIRGFLNDKIKQTDTYKILAARYPENPEIIREKLNEKHTVHLFDYSGQRCECHNRLGHDAEMSTMDSLRYMLRFMHTGFVAIESSTGEVKAYVGDVDYKTWQYDKVQARHQPGSTFKLFVYATAIRNGLTPNDKRTDEAVAIKGVGKNGGVWRPQNANGKFSGAPMTLRSGFAHSVNSIAVKLGQEYGVRSVKRTAQDMGIVSELQDNLSICLGASDVTPYELVSAYTTVANYGEHVEPHCVTRIENSKGEIIYEASRKTPYSALTPKEAFYMQSLLAAGVKEGTSRSLQTYVGDLYADNRVSLGGKTGTTNNHTDAWFVGVTPNLVAGAWVGGEYRQIRFRSGAQGQGSKAALPIVGSFFKRVLHDRKINQRYLAIYHTPMGVDAADIRGSGGDGNSLRDTNFVDSIDYVDEIPEPDFSNSHAGENPARNPERRDPSTPSEEPRPEPKPRSHNPENLFD